METYISFMRGVNMTGHNSIKMTDLSVLLIKMGLKDAETYIQSGNVIFSKVGNIPPSALSINMEQAIVERFPARMAVIFLHDEPSDNQIKKVADINYPPDKFKIIGKEIFIYCPNGFGRTKLYTNFFEKKMGVTGTARNWKTITTILRIAEKKSS